MIEITFRVLPPQGRVEITKVVEQVGEHFRPLNQNPNRQSRLYNHPSMTVTVRSFAKINLGLRIGPRRDDGFHELLTVYQTIGLHDVIRVSLRHGTGIEILCSDPRVPRDETNTCFRIVERGMKALRAKGRVTLEIEKRLPVQGGLGGASSNAVATLIGLERALKKRLPAKEKLEIAAGGRVRSAAIPGWRHRAGSWAGRTSLSAA